MCLEFLDKYKNTGFLILRLGIGGMFMWHGYGKLTAGPELWEKLGMALSYVGINFAPTAFWIFGGCNRIWWRSVLYFRLIF